IFLQSTMLAIVSFGLTIVIITGGFDLSLSSVVPASGLVAAYLISQGWSVPAAFLVGLIPGLLVGFFNGFTVLWLGVSDFIATLGTMSIVKGVVYMQTEGRSLWQGITDEFLWLGRGTVLGIPVPVIVMFIIFGVMWVLLSQTKVGRHMYAVGGNPEAARLSGISVRGIKLLGFVLGGLLASVCGVMLASRLGAGQPSAGNTYFMDAIAAAYLGQSVSSRGQVHLLGTLIGVLMISTMNNGLILLGASYYFQDLIKGLVIIAAVAISSLGGRKSMGVKV
ncbi:MAG: ABC transporter permease, partial [Firmicutes bacterium]|nr:ABC transporter permease [Bacillota bacterium]